MNVAVTTAAEGFPRRAFTVDDISRMIEAGIIGDQISRGNRTRACIAGLPDDRRRDYATLDQYDPA
jgi:hypothetical protein